LFCVVDSDELLHAMFPFFVHTPKMMEDATDRIVYLLENTEAGRAHPTNAQELKATTEVEKLRQRGDYTAADAVSLAFLTKKLGGALQAADRAGGEATAGDVALIRRLLLALTGMFNDMEIAPINSQGTALLRLQGHELADTDTDTNTDADADAVADMCAWPWDLIDRALAVDGVFSNHFNPAALGETGNAAPLVMLAAVRGDIELANRGMDIHIAAIRGWNDVKGDEEAWAGFSMAWSLAAGYLPYALRTLGRSDEAASLLAELGHAWHSTDALVDSLDAGVGLPWGGGICPRGGYRKEAEANVGWSAEDISWTIKLQQILCTCWQSQTGSGRGAASPSPSADEIAAALPAVDELQAYITDCRLPLSLCWRGREGFCGLLLLAAEVCEQIGKPAEALAYIAPALRGDSDLRPTTHAQGHALRGRVLASMGTLDEAEAAFEQAVGISHRTGLRLYEIFSLRDLTTHVLDKRGQRAEGARRLKAVLAEMKGPPAELTRLLGGGLDAEQILAGV
jgi:tetratricopeptide (TPR) repeat protein